MHYTDSLTGEIIEVETFVATLPFSNYGFAICVPTQSSTDFLFAMKSCLRFMGGVPKIFVPDNQLPVYAWFETLNEETIADAILDRLVHTSHRYELKSKSLRKKS